MFSLFRNPKHEDTDSDDEVPDVAHPSTSSEDAAATANNNNNTPPRRLTWETAFRDACLQNGALHASILQVLEQSEGGIDTNEIPTSSKVRFWGQEGSKDEIVKLFRAQDDVTPQTTNNAPIKQASSIGTAIYKVAAASVSLAKSATKVFWQSDEAMLMERYGAGEDDGDDSIEEPKQMTDVAVGNSEPLLNVPLAVDCLRLLRDTIVRHPQTGDNEHNDILVLPQGPSSAPGVFQAWLRRVLTMNEVAGTSSLQAFVQKMAFQDLNFLLEALLDCGVIKILKRRPQLDDLLIFLMEEDSSSSNEFKLAMFDLTRQIDAIEKRIDELVKRKEKCTESALHCRKTKQERQAMNHMKLRKMLDEEIGKLQGTMHNLESQRLALENAVGNREILQVSHQTANVLKDIRQENDGADDIMSSLQDEMDQNREIEEALAHTADAGGIIDEDDLLAELENLKLDDDDAPAPDMRLPDDGEKTGDAASTTVTGTVTTVNEAPRQSDVEQFGDSKNEEHIEGVKAAMVLE